MKERIVLLSISVLLAISLNMAQAGPLHDAVRSEDLALVQRLLDAGADVDALDGVNNHTPLHYATRASSMEITRLLLQRGADVNGRQAFPPDEDPETARDKPTPLHYALEYGNTQAAALLYANGAKVPNARDLVSLLLYATSQNDLATIKKLIEAGVDVSGSNPMEEYDSGESDALAVAIAGQKTDVINLLIEGGAAVASQHFHPAICQHNLALVKQLAERSRADDPWGETVGSVLECGDKAVLDYLLTKFGPLDTETKFSYVNGNANAELFAILFAKDASFATHFAKLPADAIVNGNAKLLALLFEKGVSIPAADSGGALLEAAKNGAAEIVDFLFKQKIVVDPNPRSDWGNTPLLRAAPLNHIDVAALLLQRGAEVNAKNELFNTALHMACARNLTDMAMLLIKNGARVNALNEDRNTPLLQAVRSPSKFDCVKLLVDNKANINVQNSYGMTALHYLAIRTYSYGTETGFGARRVTNPAVQEVYSWQRPYEVPPKEEDVLEAMKLLISRGADLKIKNGDGDTALDLARKSSSRPSIIKLLEESAGAPVS